MHNQVIVPGPLGDVCSFKERLDDLFEGGNTGKGVLAVSRDVVILV